MVRRLDNKVVLDTAAMELFARILEEYWAAYEIVTNISDDCDYCDPEYNIRWGFVNISDHKACVIGVIWHHAEFPMFLITDIESKEQSVLEFVEHLKTNYPQYVSDTDEIEIS